VQENRVKLDYEQWYKQVPKLVETSHEGKVPITQNQQVQANRTTSNNKLDIKNHYNEKGAHMLTDVAISGTRNVIKKEVEKILKHKDLTTEIQHMWNVKNESDTSNDGGNWNRLKITQKIPEALLPDISPLEPMVNPIVQA